MSKKYIYYLKLKLENLRKIINIQYLKKVIIIKTFHFFITQHEIGLHLFFKIKFSFS